MKTAALFFVMTTAFFVFLTSCARGYDADSCSRLADKVALSRPLDQDDYSAMIEQSGHILSDLIASADSAQGGAGAADLLDNPAFMERLDYMFTFSSVLYRAHLSGELDAENAAAYEALDSSSEQFARLCSAL